MPFVYLVNTSWIWVFYLRINSREASFSDALYMGPEVQGIDRAFCNSRWCGMMSCYMTFPHSNNYCKTSSRKRKMLLEYFQRRHKNSDAALHSKLFSYASYTKLVVAGIWPATKSDEPQTRKVWDGCTLNSVKTVSLVPFLKGFRRSLVFWLSK